MSRPSVKWPLLVAVLFILLVTGFWSHEALFSTSIAQAGQASFPDLVVSSITNPPTSAIAGTNFSVTDTTGNSGTDTANPSTTRFYLSLDATITTSDSLLTGCRSVGTLKKGSSSSGATTVTIPSNLTPGTYYLGACADALSVITESNETNNCRASTTTIAVSAPASISNLSPASGFVGLPITINGSNFGATQGTSTVRFNGILATPTNWTASAITVPVPTNATTGAVVVTVGGVASNGVTFTPTYAPRVNAGGSAYTDGSGNLWAADQFYSTGNFWGYTGGSTFSTTDSITNTNDAALYQRERYGTFGYKFDVPNGLYNVTLGFAEISSPSAGVNRRVFNVSIEGTPVLTNYDVFAAVGFDAAVTKTFYGILVQDGQLNIDLVSVIGDPIISAIQILPDQPEKLGFGLINGGNPLSAGNQFSVVVQSQDSVGNPVNVSSATGVSVTLQSGTGNLTPTTLTGTIAAGTSQVTLSNATYSKAENGVILRAARTSGDNLAKTYHPFKAHRELRLSPVRFWI